MNNSKPQKEFSKKIFHIIITLFILIMTFSMALMWKTESTDALAYLIPSVSGLAATCVGFYYWKSKMENMIKLSKDNSLSIGEIKKLEDEMDVFDVDVESEDW